MYLYAWVYLLDTPYSLDRAFEYYIPPELRGNIAKGDLVAVPFGTANRKKLGIVTESRTRVLRSLSTCILS